MKTMDQAAIRRQNVLRVWDMLQREPFLTRQRIAEGTHLSLMTVSNLIDCLSERHVLDFETEPAHGRAVGRRAERIRLSETRCEYVVLDLTDIHFKFHALTLNLRPLPASFTRRYDNALSFADNLTAFLRKARERMENETREIVGIAAATPGPYDRLRDRVRNKRMPEMNGIDLQRLLTEALGAYSCLVEEDVKLSVRAFASDNAGGDADILFYLYMGEGVGGAVLHNAQALRGLNAVSGDAAQLRGQSGETYESRMTVRAFARQLGIQPDPAMEEDELREAIDRRAAQDPIRYQRALESLADSTADMLYAVSWLIDPALVMVECPYIRLRREEFSQSLRRSLARRLGSDLQVPEIRLVPHETRSVLRGAAQALSQEWIERTL